MAKSDHKEVKEEHISPEVAALEAEPEETQTPKEEPKTQRAKFDIKAFLKTKKGKIVAAVAGAVLIIGLLFAVPFTRYAMLGVVLKKDVVVTVTDVLSDKPVTEAAVTLAGQTATTNAEGKATFNGVPVGGHRIQVSKAYYNEGTLDFTVRVFANEAQASVEILATGRQVPVVVVNKISGRAVSEVLITAGESSTKTDADGEAILVLPADQQTVKATVKASGYNDAEVEVTVTEDSNDKNKFGVVPSGKVYFLSKRTGKIDVMKSDLDGSNPEVVLAGTGNEVDDDTTLLASRDWKYLALKAKRDSDKAKVYLINTSNNQTSVIDEGDASFDFVGWSNEYFVYKVNRESVKVWEDYREVIKSYNAATGKLTTLDQNEADGDNPHHSYQWYSDIRIRNNEVVYTVHWHDNWGRFYLDDGKTIDIRGVSPSGDNKKTYKNIKAKTTLNIGSRQYKPDEIYYAVATEGSDKSAYYELEGSAFHELGDITNQYQKSYPAYILSPSGAKTTWYEYRDGKYVILTGDAAGEQEKQIISSSDSLSAYGWFGNDYILLSKNGSELFIADAGGAADPLKITDYHKVYFGAYGYGYGGY